MTSNNYELQIKDLDTQVNQALTKIEQIKFSEDNIKEYKASVAEARTLSKLVNQTRVDYEKWHKSLIENDINKLKDITSKLNNKIDQVTLEYNNWYNELQSVRNLFARKIFDDLLIDYPIFDTFNSDKIWSKIYDTKFMSDLTKNKLTKMITEKLNILKDIVSLIPVEQYKLLEECNFDVSELQRTLVLLESVQQTQPTPIEKDNSLKVIQVNSEDYEKAIELLTTNGIYYE